MNADAIRLHAVKNETGECGCDTMHHTVTKITGPHHCIDSEEKKNESLDSSHLFF